jgi:uncharacterized protein
MKTAFTPPDQQLLADFCRRWLIREVAVFGSVLTGSFSDDSDLDVLVTFRPEANWSLLDLIQAERELSHLVGRSVDLVERSVVEQSQNWIRRRSILANAKTIYVS